MCLKAANPPAAAPGDCGKEGELAAAGDAEAAKAAKRKEIEERLAALKLQKEKEAEQKTMYFGEHNGITCDGCGVGPIVGYRYKCKQCPNHDVCESCFDEFKKGNAVNGLAKQRISSDAADHTLELFKDKTFKSLVKGGGSGAAAPKAAKAPKPNEPCSCGSGKKYKKCCAVSGG